MDQPAWKIEWTGDLSVGIPEVDAEHKRFIALVNGLNQAIAGHTGLAEVRKWMLLIIEDAEQHFAHEEALFAEWNYPDAADHALKHADVMSQLGAIMDHFGGSSLDYEWIDAGLKIKQALINHLLTEDMKYRDYYRSVVRRKG